MNPERGRVVDVGGRGRRGTGASSGTAGHSAPRECGRRASWWFDRENAMLAGRRRSAAAYGLNASKSSQSGVETGWWSGAGGGGSSRARGYASASEAGLRGGGGRGPAAASVISDAVTCRATDAHRGRRYTAARRGTSPQDTRTTRRTAPAAPPQSSFPASITFRSFDTDTQV